MSKLHILYFLCFWAFCDCAYFEDQPKILTESGNLIIESAVDRNVTFRLKGTNSHLFINGLDVLSKYSRSSDPSFEHRMQVLESRLMSTEWNSGGLRPYSTRRLVSRVEAIEERLDIPAHNISALGRRLRRLENNVNRLMERLNADNCSSNPCRNGGQCTNTFGGYQCKCPDAWTGVNCDEDVNECAIFAGTSLGCQNAAVCENTRGGYNCRCTLGWQGIHCTQRTVDCLASSSSDLCGHGTCVHTNDPRAYRCICDQGWKSSDSSPACTVDINECELSMPHCSTEPEVPCINLPGTYTCGQCPHGYNGNGHYCRDIDECETNNGGCSTTPFVQCINTRGSSKCAPCPHGYSGDGRFCIRSLPDAPTNPQSTGVYPRCGANNICHPAATCYDTPTSVLCVCPPMYDGNGIGPHGCVHSNSTNNACASGPCQNGGTCVNNLFGFHCECPPNTALPLCTAAASPCTPNPCHNGGTCVVSTRTVTMSRLLLRRSFRCLCPAGRSGLLCQSEARTCGGILNAFNGTLKYPASNTAYTHNSRCAWLIKTDGDKVLNITFTMFNVERSSDCRFDWLQIHDGRSAGAHMIGRFCGNELPNRGSIIATTNLLYLWFRSDNTTALDGFALNWTSIDPTCGGDITTDSHGTIASPGSPGRYPPNRDCIWKITAPPNKQIQLHFYTMQLESHETCQYDYLAIHTGLSTDGQLLEKFCNTTHPEPLSSSSNELTLHFHSDGDSNDMGFQIHYTVIDGIPGCGGTYTASSGEISSPNRDGTYMRNVDCRYLIKIPKDSKMTITFTLFKLEGGEDCHFDYVEMFEGKNENAPKIGRWCGERAPLAYNSIGNEVLIVFHTDWSFESDGFRLKYETICGGDFDDENGGIIQSPWYPKPYEHNKVCAFNIVAPLSKAVVLNFTDFDVEDVCDFDSLSIYDGVDVNSTKIGEYCGTMLPPVATSTQNHLHLLFNTDSSNAGRGFKANYSFIDAGCGGVMKKDNQTISPPSTPSGYASDANCRWTIVAPLHHIIELTFSSFDVERHGGCAYDYLAIYENVVHNESDSHAIGRYCGHTVPAAITSTTRALTLFFKSDDSINGQGFVATYRFLDGRSTCGGRFFAPNGVIASPNYPADYPKYMDCAYIIKVPNGKQIHLDVKAFELESQSDCIYDFLEIRNGASDKSPLIGKFCDNNIPPRIDSFSNQMYLHFKTDFSGEHKGFQIEYSSAISGCGGIYRNTLSGTITSPNYPEPYTANMQCDYRIQVSRGSTVNIIFTDIDMESTAGCLFDHILIYDGPDSSAKLIGTFCRLDQMQHIESSSDAVFVRMISDVSNEGRGFEMRFSTNCKRVIHDQRGAIESPNYPNAYPHNAECEWKISPPLGNRVFMEFSNLDLEASSADKCPFDKVIVEERDSSDIVIRSDTFCNELPKPINTTNAVVIKFQSDFSYAATGFHLEYEIMGCGGTLREPAGHFTSPNYPSPYPHDLHCLWAIEVEYGQLIVIDFKDFDFEASTNCGPDGLKISADRNGTQVINQFCGSIHNKNGVVTSRDNKVYVNFYSDMSYAGKGFWADYHTIPSKCGGTFTLPQGNINSQNYPKNYESNSKCEWLLQTEDSHSIIFQFTDFDIEASDNCTHDVVRIYDGAVQNNNTLLFQSCGNMAGSNGTGFGNRPLKSTSNSMLVVFESNEGFEAKGFSAQYSMSCGSRIMADGKGSILIGHNLRWLADKCEWIIEAKDPNQHISLNIQHIENEPVFQKYIARISNDTVDDYMRKINIYDGTSSSAPKIAEVTSSKHPPAIVSEGNALTIALDDIAEKDFAFTFDFEATYSTVDSDCGGDFNSMSGEIASPGYPKTYKNNMECIWTISASPGNEIILSINMLDIEQSEHCNGDYLEIRESSVSGKLVGVYCGSDIPAILPRANTFWIKFNSNNNGVGRGFKLEYNYAELTELSGTSGAVTSMRYPGYVYYAINPYKWRITVQSGNSIEISPADLMLKRESTVKIYDGYDSTAELLTELDSDKPSADTVTSTSNVVFIELQILTFSETRFKLQWSQVPKKSATAASDQPQNTLNCTANSVIAVGRLDEIVLRSPGWPGGYAAGLDCVWTFVPAADAVGYHISQRFRTVDLEATADCISDYVQVGVGSNLQTFNQSDRICSLSFGANKRNHGLPNLRMTFHSDYMYNRSGFDSVISLDCGGVIEAASGAITTEMLTRLTNVTTLFLNRTCSWVIKVKPGRTIQMSFATLSLNDSNSGCQRHFIMRNGPHEDSPFLGKGKYCGGPDDLMNTIPRSGSNQVFVQYVREVGSPSFRLHNFTLRFEQVEYGCGGRTALDRFSRPFAIVTTPNYPNIPDPHIECNWRFSASNGELLKIEFLERFDLTATPKCTSEYVEIREGSTAQSPVLGTFCREMPRPVFTTSNYARLTYFTDVSVPRNGFKANVSIALCGRSMTAKSGVITSPGFPGIGAYPTQTTCDYYITSNIGYIVNITFTDLGLPSAGNCSNVDHLEIYAMIKELNTTESEILMATVCGDSIPEPLLSYNNKLHIRFRTVGGNHMNRGFRLRYDSVRDSCREKNIELSSGIITSPGYPIGQVMTRICEWSVTVPKGRRVRVDILDFDVRANMQQFYELAFYNDPFRLSRIRFIRNESDVGEPIYTTDNRLTIQSAIRTNSGHRGFKLQFSSDELSTCAGNLDGTDGILAGPANVTAYYCEFARMSGKPFYEANENQGTIAFKLDETPTNQSFCTAGLQTGIMVDFMADEARLIYSKCPRKYSNIASPFAGTKIAMRKIPMSSFHISYKIHNCGGRINATDDPYLAQPSFAAGYGEVDCAYTFATANSRNLQLTFTSSAFDCDRTYVNVYSGVTSKYPAVYRLCGNGRNRETIKVNAQKLFVEYHSDAYNAADTFRIDIDETDDSICGGTIRAPQYTFSSPRNGTKYPANIECEWIIQARDGYHVGIYFPHRFQLETSTDCAKDSFQIHDKVNGTWTEVRRFCGRTLPNYWNSTSNQVKVVFRTDGDGDGDGFTARWAENCGGVFRATQVAQTIVSPRYPHSYPRNSDCTYSIRAKAGEAISVKFLDFELEDSTLTCKYDNVTISRNSYGVSETVGTYCSKNMLPLVRYQTRIDIAFKSDEFLERRGFRFTYHTDQCGGNITASTRIQSTAGTADGEYLSDSNCLWYIVAPANQRIVIRMERIELEHIYQCYSDFVEVYQGHDMKPESRKARLCGNLTGHAPSISIDSNQALVRFTTDASINKGGFSAEILFVDNCNQNIELNSSQPTYMLDKLAASYNPLQDCEYFVKAPDGYLIAADFKQLHVAPCTTTDTNATLCTCDFVQIRDGGGPFAESIGKFCGHVAPNVVQSSDRHMYVRFVSDLVEQSSGFRIEFRMLQSPCGRRSYEFNETFTSVTIRSPANAQGTSYMRNLDCSWRFSSSTFEIVRIKFKNFDIEDDPSGRCELDYLEIHDDETKPYITEGLGENTVFYGSTKSNQQSFSSGRSSLTASHRYCGTESSIEYNSQYKVVDMRFKTNEAIEKSGFEFTAQTVEECERAYTALQGRIYTQTVNNCETTIQVPENYTIALYYSTTIIYVPTECAENQTIIKVYNNRNDELLQSLYCNAEIPRTLFAPTNKLKIKYLVSKASVDVTYLATDKGTGCGGELFNYGGQFTSPGYPNVIRNNTDCTWIINVPKNLLVALRLPVFDMGSRATCAQNYLEIIESSDAPPTRFCGDDTPAPYKARSNRLSVHFKSSVNFAGTGWVMEFMAVHANTELADY